MQTLDKKKKKRQKAEYFPIEAFEALIKSIEEATLLTEEQISIRTRSNEGYISQVRNRAKKGITPGISMKFVDKLRLTFAAELQNANPLGVIAGRLQQIEANLGNLQDGQQKILDQHKYTRAELKGGVVLIVNQQAGDDQQKMIKLWEYYRTIVGGDLAQDDQKGNRPK